VPKTHFVIVAAIAANITDIVPVIVVIVTINPFPSGQKDIIANYVLYLTLLYSIVYIAAGEKSMFF
jgi:hypothetical protein